MVTTSLQSFEGSVGIGTDNPSKTLHVEGNVHITEDLNILGNILIQGETTTVETTNLNIQDPIIELGKNNSLGTDLGIIMTRPGSNVAVSFLEASDELVMAYTESHSGVSSVVPITSEDLKLKVYGDLTTTGNVTATYLHGDGSELTGIVTTLQSVSDFGNTTSNTLQLTNATTGLVTTSNLEVGGDVQIRGTTFIKANSNSNNIAIGTEAGETSQGTNTVAVGYRAGQTSQGDSAVAVGYQAGSQGSQGNNAVAVGRKAGETSQGDNAIAVGRQAGETSQGTQSIAVGYRAGQTSQHDNSIVFNATGTVLDTTGVSRFYVKPIRSVASGSRVLTYDDSTGEIMNTTDFAPQSTTYTKTEVDSAISSAGGGATVDDIYPVGSVKIMYSAWSGFSGQTWVLFGSGKTLVGQDTNDPDFNTLLETGGSKTHTLTIAQIPSHQHQINLNKYGSDDLGTWTHPNPKAADGNSNQMKEYDMIGRSVAAGSGQSHPIVQPYQVVLYYRRTA
jgi:hypothetical protein